MVFLHRLRRELDHDPSIPYVIARLLRALPQASSNIMFALSKPMTP